jgi:large subunit ribosomal protein L31
MKKGTHPTWQHNMVVTCSCGSSFTTGGATDTMTVDICSACHPFFTGELKFVDQQGRVDRFMQKMQVAQQKKAQNQAKTQKKQTQEEEDALSYRQLLQKQKDTIKKAA